MEFHDIIKRFAVRRAQVRISAQGLAHLRLFADFQTNAGTVFQNTSQSSPPVHQTQTQSFDVT